MEINFPKTMNKEELWQAILAQIQFQVSQANFATWFRNTKIAEIKNSQVIISVPNNFSKEWLENKYHKILLKIFYNLAPQIKEIKYVVGPLPTLEEKQPLPQKSKTSQLNLQELAIEKETGLNPRYQFENFVVGSFNELAHAAAWGVSEKPGLVYNPLFIYGGVGLGKTHLLQAIGNQVRKKSWQKRIKYITSEKFTSDMVMAIKNQDLETFKSKYREVDLLIIDDIQFLAGKEKTQEEFFHIFNVLYEQNKQIVLSSDRPPKAIAALEERLRSRFEGGMIADISLPDFETRMAILKVKTKERNISLEDEILEYIAENIKDNIRELEGALNQLAVCQKVNNKPLSFKEAQKLLKKMVMQPKRIATPKKVIQVVAEFYDLKEKELLNPSRRQEIVRPRQIAMYLLREELKCSYPLIGRKFGGKDHTTAIYATEKIKKELEKNENLFEEISLIKQRIYSE